MVEYTSQRFLKQNCLITRTGIFSDILFKSVPDLSFGQAAGLSLTSGVMGAAAMMGLRYGLGIGLGGLGDSSNNRALAGLADFNAVSLAGSAAKKTAVALGGLSVAVGSVWLASRMSKTVPDFSWGDSLKVGIVAGVLERLLMDESLNQRMGENGLKRAARDFSWEAVAARTAALADPMPR